MNSTLIKSAALILTGVVLFAGCGDGEPTLADLNDNNIRRLHTAYKIYMKGNNFTGPSNEEDFKDFLTSNNKARVLLKRMDITSDNLSDIFVSERDGEPFKIRWGLNGVADHAIVFESVGVEGKRLVAFTKPRELDNAQYEGYWSGDIAPDLPGAAEDEVENRIKQKS